MYYPSCLLICVVSISELCLCEESYWKINFFLILRLKEQLGNSICKTRKRKQLAKQRNQHEGTSNSTSSTTSLVEDTMVDPIVIRGLFVNNPEEMLILSYPHKMQEIHKWRPDCYKSCMQILLPGLTMKIHILTLASPMRLSVHLELQKQKKNRCVWDCFLIH